MKNFGGFTFKDISVGNFAAIFPKGDFPEN